MSETIGPDPRARLKQLFAQVLELPPDQRAAFLDANSADDPTLRADVESLLAAQERAGEFFAEPTVGGVRAAGVSDSPRQQIGPYKLLQVIGEGGFGTVYLAEQEEPVRRRVAIKLIKLGMDTSQVIARFEAERQALAIMDHPNIARVFDAGATDNGRPYFVMELVKGDPITQYCDHARLNTQQRLELFIPVCQAVQHAHQKGVIHRDIKPSNVLVTLHDGKPVPKVIDFGVAKATQAKLTEKTLFTEFRQMVGTPEYMSPEQAEMSGLDIDTRSDVYSLGVLLYELLTGAPPFDPRELRSKAFAEMQRVIREVDPPKPSTRLSTLDILPNVAAHRSTEPKKLSATMRGELDWIVMKCLEKDRTRRYESPSALANDIAHHLQDEPVDASPATTAYRVRKFARRHRLGLGVAATVLLALTAGLVLALVAWRSERIAKTDAILARNQEKAARASEEDARAYEKETDRFLGDMFFSIDPAKARGKEVSVREVLESASKRIDTDPPKHALAEASLRFTFGTAFDRLGIYPRARHEMERALELEIQARGKDDMVVGTVLNGLADMYLRAGDLELAEATFRRAVETDIKAVGPDHQITVNARANLASCLMSRNKLDEADQIMSSVVEADRKNGVDPESAAVTKNTLALIKIGRGRFAEAVALNRDVVKTLTQVEGADHPDTMIARHGLAESLRYDGKFTEALEIGEPLLADARRVLGPTHPNTLRIAGGHALRLYNAGRFDEANALFRPTIAAAKATFGEDNPRTLLARSNAALVLQAQDRLDDALVEFTDIAARLRKAGNPNDPNLLIAENQIALTLSRMGRLGEAESMMRDHIPRARAIFGDQHPSTYMTIARLGAVLLQENKLADAEPLLAEAFQGMKRLSQSAPVQPNFPGNYGACLAQMGRHREAIPLLLESFDQLPNYPAADRAFRERITQSLIASYEQSGQPAEAARIRQRAATQPQPATLPATSHPS